MSENEIKTSMIVDAIKAAKGDAKKACEILGWTPDKLRWHISKDPTLKVLFSPKARADALDQTDTVHREASLPPATVDKNDKALVKGVVAEEKDLAEGIKALGLSKSGTAIAESLMEFAGVGYAPVLHMVHAGIVKDFLMTLEDIEDVQKEISNAEITEEGDNGATMLRNDRANLRDHARKVYELIQKGELIKSKIEVEREKNNKQGGTKKPGFTPVLVQGDNITITEQKSR